MKLRSSFFIFGSLLVVLLLVGFFAGTFSARASTFVAAASGEWNLGTTWGGACSSSCTEGVDYPGISNDVSIPSHIVTVTGYVVSVHDLTVSGGTLDASSDESGISQISGDLNISSGLINFGNGRQVHSAGNWTSAAGTLINAEANIDLNGSGSQTLSISDPVYMVSINSTGSVTLQHDLTASINGFSLSQGTFNANGFNVTANAAQIDSGEYIAGSGALTVNGGNLTVRGTFTGSTGTVTVDGFLSIQSQDAVFTASTNTVLKGGFSNWDEDNSAPGTFNANSGTVTATTNSQLIDSGGNGAGQKFYNLVINASGKTINATTHDISVAGNFIITSGTFSAPAEMDITGNWTNSGTFNANSGAVILNGANQTVSGSTTFNNLTKIVSSARTLTFGALATQTVTGTLTLQGNAGNLLTLVSSTTHSSWRVDPQGTRAISYVDVSDSNNINSTAIDCITNCTSNGGNTNWTFAAHTITASAGHGGNISPSGGVSVTSGEDQQFTITPNSGYSVSNVLVDAVSVGAVRTYTFSAVSVDHTISAEFRQSNNGASGSTGPGNGAQAGYGTNNENLPVLPQNLVLTPEQLANLNYYQALTVLVQLQKIFVQLQIQKNQTVDNKADNNVLKKLRDSGNLSLGSKGETVQILQSFLVTEAKGPAATALLKSNPSGNFGPLTQAALIEFQKSAHIEPASGLFGPKTRAWMKAAGY